MKEELYLKKSKTRGITYYKLFRKCPGGKDEYVLMLGTLTALYLKLVKLKKLEDQDQQFKPFLDQLIKTKKEDEKDQVNNFIDEGGVSEDKNNI